MNEQLFIMPEECLAAEVSTLMLTKKYFDKYLSKVENKQIIENLIEFQINLPIIWINQEHSSKVQEIKKNSSVMINACDGLYTQCSLQALAIKTADCLPLILSSKDKLSSYKVLKFDLVFSNVSTTSFAKSTAPSPPNSQCLLVTAFTPTFSQIFFTTSISSSVSDTNTLIPTIIGTPYFFKF